MKARVIATGKIVEVYESCNEDFPWTDEMGDKIWKTEELIFLETTDYIPDYWERLKHQYTGQFMQAMISSSDYIDVSEEAMADASLRMAHALVEKMKEERK